MSKGDQKFEGLGKISALEVEEIFASLIDISHTIVDLRQRCLSEAAIEEIRLSFGYISNLLEQKRHENNRLFRDLNEALFLAKAYKTRWEESSTQLDNLRQQIQSRLGGWM